MDIKNSITETIGNTPLVKVSKIFKKPDVQILAKLEGFNPMGSLKDRIAVWMIELAEKDGILTRDKILVESSSGNTGIGLAMVAAAKGYKLIITMPEWVSVERRHMIKSMGAELVLVDGGSDQAWDKADEIANSDPKKYFRVHQYNSCYNILAHYHTTGPEVWNQTDGKLDALVVTLGTTGTMVGAGKFLKEKKPSIKIVTVEPTAVNRQQGLRNLKTQRIPGIFNSSLIDVRMEVDDKNAFEMARRLIKEEGIFAGISSGSAMWAAVEFAKSIESGMIVVILPDRGDRYLSTELFGALRHGAGGAHHESA